SCTSPGHGAMRRVSNTRAAGMAFARVVVTFSRIGSKQPVVERTSMSIARGFLKALALIGGAFVTMVCLMSVVGVFTGNGWARAGGAIVVAVGVPLFAIDLILAKVKPDKQKGVTTDLLAVSYLGFSLAFVGVAH